ncbi:BRO1-like domain-containing protein [Lentinula raphanica]|uniref:BRO1-like domain-containing protein n=1 Tax=Lentinula raphanica TaxID=153919 RepID=A0AA38P5A8_9AGAR|nr:BRO1-like domain-containing protein [Lentinula raphanica]
MSNLLAIPFKKTYQIDVAVAARTYLTDNGDTHPDAVKTDIKQWQEMRQKIVSSETQTSRLVDFFSYHAQLTSILTKFPVDIQLEISYAPVFSPSAIPVTIRSLMFERAAVVFNLGALYSQLAASEDRSNAEGIKRAATYFQSASGVFSYLRTSILPLFTVPGDEEHSPLDLSHPFVRALELLALAQAQECFWQKAKIDNLKTGLISKLAGATMQLYRNFLAVIADAIPPIKHIYPSDWLSHVEAKQYHFEAVAQYRRSREELEKSRYGLELAYLSQALSAAKKGYDIARKGRVTPAVLNDIQSFLEILKKEMNRAERDNDLIYHQDVPAGSSLPAIQQVTLAQVLVPKELLDPSAVIPSDQMLFSGLMGWGTREAINIYNDRKKSLIQEELIGSAKESKNAADKILQSLNLPASLEALERPIGLPPSFLKKAEEVRLESGPAKIEAAIEDLYRLSRQNYKLLNEAMDILDQEASDDESTRKNLALPSERLPSHEANTHLLDKERRYRSILDQAATSDETVRTKWDQWERNITELTWDEAELEASIPSSTSLPGSSNTTDADKHARTLRSLLESLSEIYIDRDNLIKRAEKLSAADDITPRIVKAASGFERLAETSEAQKHQDRIPGVHPAMFEDVLNDELVKYDKFVTWMRNLEGKQEEVIASIRTENELFLGSRKNSEMVKAREQALQSLDISYHKYKEIIQNLEEGINFYNDLAGILLQFKESCRQWCTERKHEIHALSRSMQSMNVGTRTDQNNPDSALDNSDDPGESENESEVDSDIERQAGRATQGQGSNSHNIPGVTGTVSPPATTKPKRFMTDLNSSDWETPSFGRVHPSGVGRKT